MPAASGEINTGANIFATIYGAIRKKKILSYNNSIQHWLKMVHIHYIQLTVLQVFYMPVQSLVLFF